MQMEINFLHFAIAPDNAQIWNTAYVNRKLSQWIENTPVV